MRTALLATSLVAMTLALSSGVAIGQDLTARAQQDYSDLPPSRGWTETELCTPAAATHLRRDLTVGPGMPDGEPISFRQVPPVLRPDHQGPFGLVEFFVLGDVPTVTFERRGGTESGVISERWTRTRSTRLNGRVVSVFEPQWPASAWSQRLRHERHGFDRPYVLWGHLVAADTAVHTAASGSLPKRSVYLRVGSTNLPRSEVRQLAPDVQYSSHVVNLVVPGFGDTRAVFGTYNYDLPSVSRKFYQHFDDSYDSIAFVPQRSQLAAYGGFHRNVKNDVAGIGKPLFDQSHLYGSTGRLQSVEVFSQGQFASNADSSHEIAHQWGDAFDWTRLAGITAGGWHPSSHTPLLYRGETLIGSVLAGARRVARRAARGTAGDYVIERTNGPMQFHPLQLYRMGHLPAESVPDVFVFTNQDQFGRLGGRTPEPGTIVAGQTRRVTIDNIVAHHGPRRGPRPSVWRRATVVVSRDGLASPEEMDYWNFVAQRLSDPNRTGILSYDGYPSFDALTGYRVDLQTDIRPLGADPIKQPLTVDAPDFGRRDWRGVVFDTTVPSAYVAGTRTRLSGRVPANTHTGTATIDTVLVRLWKQNGTSDEALRFWGDVEPDGSFEVDVEPPAPTEGTYSVGVFLFWPGAGAQHPRGLMTPAYVSVDQATN